MSIVLPRVLSGFDVLFNGDNYAGRCEEFTLPKNAPLFEVLNAGGLLRPLKINVGFEEDWTVSFMIKDLNMDLLSHGSCEVNGNEIVIFGALKDADGCEVIPLRCAFTGQLASYEQNTLKKNELSEGTAEFQCTKVEYYIAGKEVFFMDSLNYIYRVNGEDQLKGMLQALGRA